MDKKLYYKLYKKRAKRGILKEFEISKALTCNIDDILKTTIINAKKCITTIVQDNVNFVNTVIDVVPFEYYGCHKNKKAFRKILHKYLTTSKAECMYTTDFYNNFNLSKLCVFKENAEDAKKNAILVNIWLLENIFIPLIYQKYSVIYGRNTYELHFIPRNKVLSFTNYVKRQLIPYKLVPIANKKTKKTIPEKLKLIPIGRLKLIPKGNISSNNFRAIVEVRLNKSESSKNKEINKVLWKLTSVLKKYKIEPNIHTCWSEFIKRDNKQIYGVVLDIKDAFNSVKLDVLINLIGECPFLSIDMKKQILKSILSAFVTYEKGNGKLNKVGSWNYGLLQGAQLSSVLCELYITYLEKQHLTKYYANRNYFIHRTVDDYFFCSTSKEEVLNFTKTLLNIFTINVDKICSNIEELSIICGFPYSTTLKYCGYIFDLNNKFIKRNIEYNKGFKFHHRYRLWNLQKPLKPKDLLVKNLEVRANHHYFNKVVINMDYNPKLIMLQNYFEAMLILSFKVDCLIKSRGNIINDLDLLNIIDKTIKIYNNLSKKLVGVKNYEEHKLRLIFTKLGYLAFLMTFKIRSELYSSILTDLKYHYNRIKIKLDIKGITKNFYKFRNISKKRIFEYNENC